MSENNLISIEGLVRRATGIGESLVEQPAVQGLLGQLSTWGERTARVQEAALGALGLPTAVGVSKLERRVRGVSERLERLEDHLDRLSGQMARGAAPDRAALGELTAEIAAMRATLADGNGKVAAKA
jgi:hypothetical protein